MKVTVYAIQVSTAEGKPIGFFDEAYPQTGNVRTQTQPDAWSCSFEDADHEAISLQRAYGERYRFQVIGVDLGAWWQARPAHKKTDEHKSAVISYLQANRPWITNHEAQCIRQHTLNG